MDEYYFIKITGFCNYVGNEITRSLPRNSEKWVGGKYSEPALSLRVEGSQWLVSLADIKLS
jgi:hypothetical protein